MYISGNITDGSAWETCVISKNVTLTTWYESKSISMKWKDTEGNETSIITKNIDFSLCSYDECLSDGYYVIASWNSTYPQWCKTSWLTNVETHCVLKLWTLYIAPSSTEGNNIEFINASAICTNWTWWWLTWRLPNDAQAWNELNTMYDNRALLYDDSRSTDCYWDDDQDLGCFRTTYDVYPDWTAPRQVRCVRSS